MCGRLCLDLCCLALAFLPSLCYCCLLVFLAKTVLSSLHGGSLLVLLVWCVVSWEHVANCDR